MFDKRVAINYTDTIEKNGDPALDKRVLHPKSQFYRIEKYIYLTLEPNPILSFLIGTLKSRRPLDLNILWEHEYFSLRFSGLTIQAQVRTIVLVLFFSFFFFC